MIRLMAMQKHQNCSHAKYNGSSATLKWENPEKSTQSIRLELTFWRKA
jgi:hypothetical protein